MTRPHWQVSTHASEVAVARSRPPALGGARLAAGQGDRAAAGPAVGTLWPVTGSVCGSHVREAQLVSDVVLSCHRCG